LGKKRIVLNEVFEFYTNNNKIDILNQVFKSYGFRWHIDEYHRLVKQEYGLEKIQMRIFAGLQSILAILTVAINKLYLNRYKLDVK
jgi:hypothetical protein